MSKNKSIRGQYVLAGLLTKYLSLYSTLTPQEFAFYAVETGKVKPEAVRKFSGNLFKGFRAAGVLEKTGKCKLNDNSTVAVEWRAK
jgi:hypothetical protein